jgi:hypothetical protein
MPQPFQIPRNGKSQNFTMFEGIRVHAIGHVTFGWMLTFNTILAGRSVLSTFYHRSTHKGHSLTQMLP